MMIRFFKFFLYIAPLLIVAGCSDSDSDIANDYLIRVGDKIVTVLEFKRTFEITKTAYPHNWRQKPAELREAQLRHLNQMSLELILLARAEELGITVSDEAVEKAVAGIKADYPAGEFEQALLEAAISYDSWKNRLKIQLLIQKLIQQELKDQVTISPEDIADYYEQHYQGSGELSENDQQSQDLNESIIANLRREKTESVYKFWIEDLKTKYPVQINDKAWQKYSESDEPVAAQNSTEPSYQE